MDFRIKCALQHVFSAVPGGRKLNYLMQRHVSRSIPYSEAVLAKRRSVAAQHIERFKAATGRHPKTVFEFGSGWDLSIPIMLGLEGCRVTASDIKHGISDFLVNHTLRKVGLSSLKEASVEYIAPCDARATGFADGSFDMITSTSVLEHIPADHIPAIVRECHRILADDGACSFLIDYQDHWSYFDRRISWSNFLRYDARTWKLYNPPLQFQNRLRHSDYVAMFLEHFHVEATPERRDDPPSFALAADFRHYGHDDLSISGSWFVLTKRHSPSASRSPRGAS